MPKADDTLSLPTAEEIRAVCPELLPSWKYPSDHLMIGADLVFQQEIPAKKETASTQEPEEETPDFIKHYGAWKKAFEEIQTAGKRRLMEHLAAAIALA